jgi:lipopolysaccharide transport system permease protein
MWWQLTVRDVIGRYKGSALGWIWSLLTPLLMLGVYTFVFSGVFKSRWDNLGDTGTLGFATNLFAGLIVFNVFAESLNKAPQLIPENANYVTKVIFPLEILSAVTVASAGFHAATSLVVLAVFQLLTAHHIPLTALWLPLVWVPLFCWSLSLSWVLSALGVYLRDVGQVVGVVTNMLMFLSAVFYPLSSLPPLWQPILALNPLVWLIEQTRHILILGTMPNVLILGIVILISIALCELSFRSFSRARRGFADVL